MQAAMETHHPSDPLVAAAESLTIKLEQIHELFHAVERKPAD